MPIAIILTIMPAALLGTVMVLMAPDDRTTALAIGFAVFLTGILFIAIMVLMRDQHPSQAGGDSHLPQDRSPEGDDDEDSRDGDLDEDDDLAAAVTRWRDDGAPPLGR